ncbi:DUF2934 domain-containing protein [Ancylobacter oerskovii]|uniref:DUF2934 domain-containing protein n=1 Tax=Ancylobacter oerskovii TaxID=459519 RepID=A0ABW4YZR9_9HYPH|nr:DUF2934 domain-containing protein [Ancylobacter oerskovii]MBS7543924.1 DUF2934 domain-containing protein [Ancylobacter oerskovii]
MSQREDRIREQAYRLWEEEGRPDGRADRHWSDAERLVAIEQGGHEETAPAAGGTAEAEEVARLAIDPNVLMAPEEHEPVSEIDTIHRTLEVPPARRRAHAPLADEDGALSGLAGTRLEE